MITWITPAGFLGIVTELTPYSFSLVATGDDLTYRLISGNLPNGLTISKDGIISGTPALVSTTTRYKFVVRATDNIKSDDRTFTIDVVNIGNPSWQTPAGILPIGHFDQIYDTYNREFISFQLSAIPINQPANTVISYQLIDGNLPPDLVLDRNGLISGKINIDFDKYTDTDSLRQYFTATIAASDGFNTSTRTFNILVTNPDMFKADSSFLNLNTSTLWNDFIYYSSNNLTSSVSSFQPVQFINGSNLGTVRASTNEIISVGLYSSDPSNGFIYDPDPKTGPVTYNLITGTTMTTQLPQGLQFDTNSGNIYGFLPYQPAYTINYSFAVEAIKTNNSTGDQIKTSNTFTLAVKGNIESTIKWITTATLNSIVAGETSELSVVAQDVNSTYNVRYKLISGNLPNGLIFNQDGTIGGSPEYNAVGDYEFTVQAGDVYGLSAISKSFNLTVTAYDNKQYTKIYLRPFLSQSSRKSYANFIYDDNIFPQSQIYRFFDNNFGIQPNIKMYLEFGIEQLPGKIYVSGTQSYWFLSDQTHTTVAIDKTLYPEIVYIPLSPYSTITIHKQTYIITNVAPNNEHDNLYNITFEGLPEITCADSFLIDGYQGFMTKVIEENFNRRKLYFGDIKIAVAQDIHRNDVYEVVYVDIHDNLINPSNITVSKVITDPKILYPASITNMRVSLESVNLPNGALIGVDEYNLPRFMRTAQGNSYSPLGYIRIVPLCYALPGQGAKIVDRIKNSGFQFNRLDFEIDRLVVGKGPNNDSNKYLIFNKQSIDDGQLHIVPL